MAVPTQLSDLSATAASNSPAGSDTVGTTMDDYIRSHASIIARISAGTDALATPNIGAATGTSVVLSGAATVNGAFTSLGLDDNATTKALTLSGSGANSVTIANSATHPSITSTGGNLALNANTSIITTSGQITIGTGFANQVYLIGSATDPTITTTAGNLRIGAPVIFTAQSVASTVGAAGGASALPATPLGYLTTSINGTACKIPYYTA